MGSKAIVFLGLFVAMLLLVSSEVIDRDLVEETSKGIEAEPDQGGGGGGGYGCPRCCSPYGCVRCCGGRCCGGRCCRGGCCSGMCCPRGCCRGRCCYAGETVDADLNEAETHN